MTGQLIQVLASLGLVLLLIWAAARVLRRTAHGKATGALEVLARQPLSRTASLAVVRVADRALVVGVAEGRVSLLTETDLASVRTTEPVRETREPVLTSAASTPESPSRLAGSALSPATWRTAVEVLRERTARRA
ncbi:MAG TPA: flagellar biosynthetic protein FliO [Actinomycetes bacterium]|nr:flagellar biosynthetic protein FliO [Actinomycetes bacterium]